MIKFLGISIRNVKCISVIILLIIIVFNSTSILALRINEVELNPAGDDYGNEWIEFYSDNVVNLDGWRIENVKGKNMSLNGSFSDYKIVTGIYNFLTNEKQKLILYDNLGNKVDETIEISDTGNDARSWQFCEGWEFSESTMEKENNCDKDAEIIENGAEEEKVDDKEEEEEIEDNEEEKNTGNEITAKVIKENPTEESPPEILYLNPKDIKSNEIWKSDTRKIKEYSIFGFTLLLILVLIYLINIKNGRRNKSCDDF